MYLKCVESFTIAKINVSRVGLIFKPAATKYHAALPIACALKHLFSDHKVIIRFVDLICWLLFFSFLQPAKQQCQINSSILFLIVKENSVHVIRFIVCKGYKDYFTQRITLFLSKIVELSFNSFSIMFVLLMNYFLTCIRFFLF